MKTQRLKKTIRKRKKQVGGRGPALAAPTSGNFIRAWREYSGYATQQSLSKVCGISRPVLCRLEAGMMCYREDLLIQLGLALDCSPHELLWIDPAKMGSMRAIYNQRFDALEKRFANSKK